MYELGGAVGQTIDITNSAFGVTEMGTVQRAENNSTFVDIAEVAGSKTGRSPSGALGVRDRAFLSTHRV